MKIYLVLASVANFGFGVLGFLPAMMSPMMFDAPGSTENNTMWIAFYAILAFPVVAFAAAIAPWLFHWRRRAKAAVVSSLSAIGWAGLLAIFMSVALPNP